MDIETIKNTFIQANTMNSENESKFANELEDFIKLLNEHIILKYEIKNEILKTKYLPSFSRWNVGIGSIFYKNDETSLFSYFFENGQICRECPVFFPNNDFTPLEYSDNVWNDIAYDYKMLFENEEFNRKIRVYEDLSSRAFFDLEIYYDEIYRYSPHNLILKVAKADFKRFLDGETICVHQVSESAVHKPFSLDNYIGHKGEINGFVGICMQNPHNSDSLLFSKIG